MIFKKIFLLIGFVIGFTQLSHAQLRIPTFDVELKISQNLIPGDGSIDGNIAVVETTNIYGAAHVQINQYIAIGGFYSRSFRGNGRTKFQNSADVNQEVQFAQKGLDVRISNGRAKNWRKYLSVSYSQVELVQVTESFRLADKSNAFGLRLGIMRRLSNNLYLNVIELGCSIITDDIFWFDSEPDTNLYPIFDAKMGLTYNIGKRK